MKWYLIKVLISSLSDDKGCFGNLSRLIGHLHIFCEEPVQIFCSFFITLYVLLLVLYILDMSYFSDRWLANVFSELTGLYIFDVF